MTTAVPTQGLPTAEQAESLSRIDIAQATGYDRSYISYLLNPYNSRRPSLEASRRLARYFDVTLDAFCLWLDEFKRVPA